MTSKQNTGKPESYETHEKSIFRETLLVYPYFSKLLVIHIDSSKLVTIINQ